MNASGMLESKRRAEVPLRNAACLAASLAASLRAVRIRPACAAGVARNALDWQSSALDAGGPPLPEGAMRRESAEDRAARRRGDRLPAGILRELLGRALGAAPASDDPGGAAARSVLELMRWLHRGGPDDPATRLAAVRAEGRTAAAVARVACPLTALRIHREAWGARPDIPALDPARILGMGARHVPGGLHVLRLRLLGMPRWDEREGRLSSARPRLPWLAGTLAALPRRPGTGRP